MKKNIRSGTTTSAVFVVDNRRRIGSRLASTESEAAVKLSVLFPAAATQISSITLQVHIITGFGSIDGDMFGI
ncbi:hypothetical protein P8452_46508 [Trifolium repens]|nr:hypothetical protein P8452_41750 [Trifolium repens]WJX61416.1 hypothetical protein P8452_46508 [Trifolium repens]